MFFEASAPRKKDETARIVSESLGRHNFIGYYCLRFWYHMYGSSIGELSVILKTGPGKSKLTEKTLWVLRGQQGTTWLSATVPLYSTVRYQVKYFD